MTGNNGSLHLNSNPENELFSGKAACIGGGDIFFAPFAERPEQRVAREAKARPICAACVLVVPCREYARNNLELGFWAGESEVDRAAAGYIAKAPLVGSAYVSEVGL